MTKYTPTDFNRATCDIARALSYEIRALTTTKGLDPLTWQVELEIWQERLKTLNMLAALWQDSIDHDAEADRQAQREEETSDLF